MNRPRWVLLVLVAVVGALSTAQSHAQGDPSAVLDFRFTAAPRAQIAIWVEDAQGHFLGTVALTEATAFRGIGNRPGASQMNSGYRWPYGRREGVLPVWARRRATAAGAAQFRRVIFQNRTSEGCASRTSNDSTVDTHFCLSFTDSKNDALDAVSCASVFSSDKGRFITQLDLNFGYAEPYEPIGTTDDIMAPLSVASLYPPRMDVTRCAQSGCVDHEDVAMYAEHARSVMPEIDSVTAATPRGGEAQSWLFTVPENWPAGDYVAWLEVNVEGDYAPGMDASAFPTPTFVTPDYSCPAGKWDAWAVDFGYPYRGQPSVVFKVPFELGTEGETSYATSSAAGASSWDVWAGNYGTLGSLNGIRNDPTGAPGSGVDRLHRDANGQRLRLIVNALRDFEPPDPDADPPAPPRSGGVVEPPLFPGGGGASGGGGEGGAGGSAGSTAGAGGGGGAEQPVEMEDGVTIVGTPESLGSSVGAVRGLKLQLHPDELHRHEWVRMRLRVPDAGLGLHRYEVRVSDQPMTSEESFLKYGRPAKTATESKEGGASLMLPVDAEPGEELTADIGELSALTRWYVGIRAVDKVNRPGPISIANIKTPERVFTTVTPCVIASAAYGSPLAARVGVFRRFRDRFLASHAPGRWLIGTYYRHGPVLARQVATHTGLRDAVRSLLDPLSGWLAAL